MEVEDSPEFEEAADGYEEYVVEQSALLEERTEAFTDAVIAGDVEEAKRALRADARAVGADRADSGRARGLRPEHRRQRGRRAGR